MRSVPLTEILIAENRQRREFADESTLADSIAKHSLLHPPVVRRAGSYFQLVAGERRIKAIKQLWMTGGTLRCDGQSYPEGSIPVLELGDLSPLAAEEAELEENIRRKDLSWQERAAATSRLEKLRRDVALEKGDSPPSLASIAEETFHPKRDGMDTGASGYGVEATRRELIVARHLANPEIAKARTLDDAYKMLKRQEAVRQNAALAEVVGATYGVHSHRLLNQDCVAWLSSAAADQFDCILTDPPYGINADQFEDAGGAATPAHNYQDSTDEFIRLMEVLPQLLFRVVKPAAHLYLFCDIDWFDLLKAQFGGAGWAVHRTPLIWHKPNGNRVPWVTTGPQRKWEMLLYAIKGGRNTTQLAPDLITCPSDENLGLSAQKPVALYSELLKRSCRPGDTVLDPFCGTGPLFPAAHEAKLYATGLEIEPATYAIAVKRLKELE
jgi:site-specific DNA-methyltransferase (adenine-specific)